MQLRKLQVRGRRAVWEHCEWLTAEEICERAGAFAGESIVPEQWHDAERIFALIDQQKHRYPRYALDASYRPLPIMGILLRELDWMDWKDPMMVWRIAVWFESSNAWLDGASPRTRLSSDAVSVLRALQYYAHGAHG